MLKSRNLVEFARKSKNIKIKNILKVALISGHTVQYNRAHELCPTLQNIHARHDFPESSFKAIKTRAKGHLPYAEVPVPFQIIKSPSVFNWVSLNTLAREILLDCCRCRNVGKPF